MQYSNISNASLCSFGTCFKEELILLLDFVKKHIGDIEMDVTGHYHDTYPAQYSPNDVSEYEDIVFIGSSKYAPTVAVLNHTPTQKDLEVTGTNRDDWRLEYSLTTPPGENPAAVNRAVRKNLYWHAYVKDKPTLKENKMQEFDLKKYLVENKMTRNSRLLNEQPEAEGIPADDPLAQIPAVPAETPEEPSGEIDKETAKELIFDTKGKFFTVTFIKKDGSERVMNARLGVKKYLRGGELKYDPAEFNYITVYDMGAKGYRMVNANTIQNLKIGKNEYVVPTAVSESQIDENASSFDQAMSGMMGSSNNNQSVKASFEGKWNPVPKANKDVLDKSTGKDTQLVGVFGQSNYAIAKGSDGKFYRYQYRQASTPGTPKGPFDTVEKAKEGIK